jgi:hypothetical protein
MVTLKRLREISKERDLGLSSSILNFVHKNQPLSPEGLPDLYSNWFSSPGNEEVLLRIQSLVEVAFPKADEHVSGEPTEEPEQLDVSDQDYQEQAVEPEPNLPESTSGLMEPSSVIPEDQLLEELGEAQADYLSSEISSLDEPETEAEESDSHDLELSADQERVEPSPSPLESEVKEFQPWWTDEQSIAEPHGMEEATESEPLDVSAFLETARVGPTHRFENVESIVDVDGAVVSWPPMPGATSYVVSIEQDHYPFDVSFDNAAALTSDNSVKLGPQPVFLTVFAFQAPNQPGVTWAKGRIVPDLGWLTAEVVDGKVALRWSGIPDAVEIRIARSKPDQELPENPAASSWLNTPSDADYLIDSDVELGFTYHYRAYLQWTGPDGLVHSTEGKSVSIRVLVEFPEVRDFTVSLDESVSGLLRAHVRGDLESGLISVHEVDGLPDEKLLQAVSDKLQLGAEDLGFLQTIKWLGQPVLGNLEAHHGGVELTTTLTNAGKSSKTFVLVLIVGRVAQVTALDTVQRVGEIRTASIQDRYDYQLLCLDQPLGAQTLDIWVVAPSVPFDRIAHTAPTRKVIIAEEYLLYGGILFADNVPEKPHIRRLAPDPQNIYIRGASTFGGQVEYGEVIRVNYPGRIEVSFELEEKEPDSDVTSSPRRPKKVRKGDSKRSVPNAQQAKLNESPIDTNSRLDKLGLSLMGESQFEAKQGLQHENYLQKLLSRLRRLGKRPVAVASATQGKRLLVKLTGAESIRELPKISVLHFAANSYPLDQFDSQVSKAPLELSTSQFREKPEPYKLPGSSDTEVQWLRVEPELMHRLQVQCDLSGDLLRGYRCFSLDSSVDAEVKRMQSPTATDRNISIVILGPPGAGKSTYLAALTHYLQGPYEILSRSEVIEVAGESSRLRDTARALAREGTLPSQGRPITENGNSATTTLEFSSGRPVELREVSMTDTSGLDLGDSESLNAIADTLLKADLIIFAVDPSHNLAVGEITGGVVPKTANIQERHQPFWMMKSLVDFLDQHAASRRAGQKIAVCLTKLDAMQEAAQVLGTALTGTIRSGMALARDPHLLWSGAYLESDGRLLDKEVKSLLGRVSGMRPFVQLVQDRFKPDEVRYFANSAIGRSSFSSSMGAGLTSVRISDPIRWVASHPPATGQVDEPIGGEGLSSSAAQTPVKAKYEAIQTMEKGDK